jgi:crotonobetainyl-CoA:carnitine CoA-transferase CaiB-like acyl-CoA transferase
MLGAEIIKIENPRTQGDVSRATGPFKGDVSLRFCSLNHSKHSVALDLTTPEGRDIFLRMAKKSHIVIENFRPGVMEKLGIGYDVLKRENPRIVFGSLSGFGKDGPYRDLPAYDVIAQALSGIMWLNGWEEDPPIKVGTSIADVTAGLNLVIGVLAALREAERTGEGRFVEVSLIDSLVSLMIVDNQEYLFNGILPERIGNNNRKWAPYGVYRASNGYFAIGVGSDEFFQRLALDIFNRPDMAADPRFASHTARVEHRELIDDVLNQWAGTLSVKEVCRALGEAGIPCAPVNTIGDAVADEHIGGARQMFPSLDQEGIGPVPVTQIPLRIHDMEDVPLTSAPRLGEQNGDILCSLLNLSDDEIQGLIERNILGTHQVDRASEEQG